MVLWKSSDNDLPGVDRKAIGLTVFPYCIDLQNGRGTKEGPLV